MLIITKKRLTTKKLGFKTLVPIPKGINFNEEGDNDE